MHAVNVVGAGVKGMEQLTLQAINCLKQSNKVLYLGGSIESKELVNFDIKPIESINSLYKNGATDEENYRSILEKIYNELAQNNNLSVLIPGHPKVGVSIAQYLYREREARGFKLNFIPGISSFDTMMIDLARDPLERGTMIVDVNRLLLFRYHIETAMDVYIYHVCSIANRATEYLDPHKNNKVELLQNYLLEYYANDHPVKLVASSARKDHPSVVHDGIIGDLAGILTKVNFDSSLFIPSSKPKVIDQEFLKFLTQ